MGMDPSKSDKKRKDGNWNFMENYASSFQIQISIFLP